MKILKWYRPGQEIPNDAKYLSTHFRVIGYEAATVGKELIPVHEDWHLFELPDYWAKQAQRDEPTDGYPGP